jgi:hypothetical protein
MTADEARLHALILAMAEKMHAMSEALGRVAERRECRRKGDAMSLDVYLTRPREESTEAAKAAALLRANDFGQFAFELECRHDCASHDTLYEANITHNLNRMAVAAGIYEALWRPEEIGITKAAQLIPLLEAGLAKLHADPKHFETFNSPNGWGLYVHFVPFVANYLEACREYPDADVQASR